MLYFIVAAIILSLLGIFGMAKWTSVIFSDIRKKLGNSVVFTAWKGRGVMRAYKIPANPNTLAQQARRDLNRLAVLGYQTQVSGTPVLVTAWNFLALSRLISGFNLWMKYAGKTWVSVEATQSEGEDVHGNYTAPTDNSQLGLYRWDDAPPIVEIIASGSLEAGDNKSFTDTSDPAQGTSGYFIGPGYLFDEVENGTPGALCAHWKVNETTGIADPADCIITP